MNPNARTAYMDASVATASPAKLLVMVYERLALDCRRALDAQRTGDHATAHEQLLHAQDIVTELHSSLKVDLWAGGPAMSSLYDYLHSQLVQANVKRDQALTEECLALVTDLCETWREAALQTLAVGA
jgi:flagellar protein FliS